MTIIYRILGIGLLVLIWASCAQIVAPTGGTIDTTPPKIEKEFPKNKNISFTGEKIVIKFDEYIQLKNTEDQIVISPPMDAKPQFEVFGKSIVITLQSILKPQTTYTINFGNSIVDNHEGNILSGYTYVFSSGSSIDSLNIKGVIQNAYDLKPEKNLSVCLYETDSFSDSTIYLKKPLYFNKTNENGSFSLDNLPSKTFEIVAFKDENKNLKYDKNELIAFYDKQVNSSDSTPLKTAFSFQPNLYSINRIVDTFCNQIGKYTFVVYKPTKLRITPEQEVNYVTWLKKGKDQLDTITLMSTAWKEADSVSFIVNADSTYMVTLKPKRNAKQGKFMITLPKEVELNDTITIRFNQPYETVKTDTNGIVLKEDSTIVPFSIIYGSEKDVLKLYYPLKEKTKYRLEIKDSAITDFYGAFNKPEKSQFTTKGIKDYSNLYLSVLPKNDSYSYLLQVIDPADTRVYHQFTINQKSTIPLTYVLPGKYRIKIVRDSNGNKQWDNGDYQKNKQPERVFYYPEVLVLRAYWDLEQIIDLEKIVN